MPETTETHSIRGHFIPAPPLPLGDDVKALFAASPRLSSLTPDELLAHIIKTRDEAYALVPFPCLGSFRFLSPGIRSAAPGETYAKLVQHLKGEADGLSNGVPRSILDLGCGLGQDTRALVVDGVPSERIVAADLSQDFLIIGHAMYGDKPSEGSIAGVRWTTCDVFEADDVEKVATMAGQEGFGTIYVGSFIHLFSLRECLAVPERLKLRSRSHADHSHSSQRAKSKSCVFCHSCYLSNPVLLY